MCGEHTAECSTSGSSHSLRLPGPSKLPATAHDADKKGGPRVDGASWVPRDRDPGTRDPAVLYTATSPRVRELPEGSALSFTSQLLRMPFFLRVGEQRLNQLV